jgi:hypothetical protein
LLRHAFDGSAQLARVPFESQPAGGSNFKSLREGLDEILTHDPDVSPLPKYRTQDKAFLAK